MNIETDVATQVRHVTGSGVPSLSQQVYEYLVDRIIRGDIQYGDRLNIKTIAAQLQVSPMPIRDAIKHLEAENIVIVKPRSNCYVRRPTREMMLQAVESRTMIELFAIEKIVSSISRSELNELKSILARMRATVEKAANGGEKQALRDYIELDRLFHTELCRLARNDYLNRFYREISLHLNMSFRYGVGTCHGLSSTLREHEQIYHHLANHSAEAARVLRTHLEQSIQNIFEEHALS